MDNGSTDGTEEVGRKLAAEHADVAILRLEQRGRGRALRTAWMQSRGVIPHNQTSMAKVFKTELAKRVANLGMEILGPYGQLTAESKLSPARGMAPHSYLGSKGYSLQAGTSEILRNIIAQRGLGLPA